MTCNSPIFPLVLFACLAAACSANSSSIADLGPSASIDATIPTDAQVPDLGFADAESSDLGAIDSSVPDMGVSTPDVGPVDLGTTIPTPPADLVRYLTGNADDAPVMPQGPGLILMGGSREVDLAFETWKKALAGGDVEVIRSSGSDGYNDYLYQEIGGADSVETLLITSKALADDPYVAYRLRTAEAIHIAGGDQSRYINYWKDTETEEALHYAFNRGAVLSGTSAGLAMLGEISFAAHRGSITSEQALNDPQHSRLLLENDFLKLPWMQGIICDSHFVERDRMGRLISFLARIHADGLHSNPVGIGVDERTAIYVDENGLGTVMGRGKVHVVRITPESLSQPLNLEQLSVQNLSAGQTIQFPGANSSASSRDGQVRSGQLQPADLY